MQAYSAKSRKQVQIVAILNIGSLKDADLKALARDFAWTGLIGSVRIMFPAPRDAASRALLASWPACPTRSSCGTATAIFCAVLSKATTSGSSMAG